MHQFMENMEKKIKEVLLDEAKKVYKEEVEKNSSQTTFSNNEVIDIELHDLKNHAYMFVLGCVMDRQIKAERAWEIPHKVCAHFNVKNFQDLVVLTESDIVDYFKSANLHRYAQTMGGCFYKAVLRINKVYNGDASKIWSNNPSSASVVYQFLCFDGVGIKIATMAANILSRTFGIHFSDMSAIDVSPDIQVRRILYRLGLVEIDSRDAVIYKAKEINPQFPGLIDIACWKWGRDYCHPTNPKCNECPMKKVCLKKGVLNN